MSKSILVVDTPKSCMNCQFRAHNVLKHWCEQDKTQRLITENVLYLNKPEWCPLKPIPEKYDVLAAIENNPNYDPSYDIGRNDCIDKILGE